MCDGPRPFIPAAGIIKVQMVYVWNGQRVENVFNVRSGGGSAIADLDRIQTLMAAWHNTNVKPQQNAGAVLSLWVLDALNTAAGAHKEYPVSVAGTGGGSGLTNNATVAVKWNTGLRGRSFRGRTYHIGLHGGLLVDGARLSTAGISSLTAAYNALLTAFAAAGTPDRLVVLSYCADGVWRSDGLATNVNSVSVDVNVDSQRRRLAGRGL